MPSAVRQAFQVLVLLTRPEPDTNLALDINRELDTNPEQARHTSLEQVDFNQVPASLQEPESQELAEPEPEPLTLQPSDQEPEPDTALPSKAARPEPQVQVERLELAVQLELVEQQAQQALEPDTEAPIILPTEVQEAIDNNLLLII